MFPIRDHNPSGMQPFVTQLLIAANVLIFLSYQLTLEEWQIYEIFAHWGLIPARIAYGEGYHTLFTHMFLHAGWMHIIGNMLFLWIFGDNLEERMGRLRFLAFYLAGGLAAAALQLIVDWGSMAPMVGASGAVAGVMGGYLLLFPRARVDVFLFFIIFFRIQPLPTWAVLGFWFGLQIFSGLSTPTEAASTAYWAHVGGFVAGLVLTLPLLRRLGGRSYWSQTHGAPPHPEARYALAQSRIPKVPRR
ncbi:rhomboid family intramembrane serine protease [Xinfangfangia sp. CPCC 101601]|uniref:Rhomboid family intramembrane serine protease n=1 Tax=Pseudogemmobacter lacusdianii TaxID=3069608 RepID=A0ABU0VTN9_9RHOB|nr:rhomboid family intramembrane serine protease [Xinfangfangia sp. CPCC 101601]MDQ2064903.1 rhomboid family intramembrane serine protease [Xinfangfangia sp. CPCC 101601]